MRTAQIIEALLFASDAPLSAADLARGDEGLDEDQVEAAIEELRADYEAGERSFQIYEIGGGYQILTRPEFAPYLERFDTVPQNPRLSGPALEVLAVIAYRQPIGRAEIEEIRGVGSAGVLRTLLDRGVVEVVARGEGLGRPLLYGTTSSFLQHFGFRSLEDLPRPEELPVVLRARAPSEEYGATAGQGQGQGQVPGEGEAKGQSDGVTLGTTADAAGAGAEQALRAAGGGDGDVDGNGDGNGDGEA